MLRRIGLFTSDLLLIAVGVVAIVVSVRALFSVPETTKELAPLIAVILNAIGFVLVAIVIERRVRLDPLQAQIQTLVGKLAPTSEYLSERKAVADHLLQLASTANDRILALGARSTEKKYFDAVETAIKRRSVNYHRVINGDYIFHEMHQHLLRVHGLSNVFLTWVAEEKYGNMCASENDCILAFPSPYLDKFTGIFLRGEKLAAQYGQYVLTVASSGTPVDTEKLSELCLTCRPATPELK